MLIKLTEFDIEVIHRPGKELIIADFFSRNSSYNKLVTEIRKENYIEDDLDIKNVLVEDLDIAIIDKIKQETKVDETSNLLKKTILKMKVNKQITEKGV